ncbi:MAG: hypothetical protein HYY93_02770 [Planctomycetes bacterium]|nr:hypothetical protein [Planctomycetota bacterium]
MAFDNLGIDVRLRARLLLELRAPERAATLRLLDPVPIEDLVRQVTYENLYGELQSAAEDGDAESYAECLAQLRKYQVEEVEEAEEASREARLSYSAALEQALREADAILEAHEDPSPDHPSVPDAPPETPHP